jgi:hypothetical protein
MMTKTTDELFQAPAQISKIETMSDGGVRVVIDTQEITDSEEMAKLFRLRKGDLGFFLFKNSAITNNDLPDDIELEEGESKTPSQRLRNTLFVYWKEVKEGRGDFNGFYREQMEKFITLVKEKLPPKSAE